MRIREFRPTDAEPLAMLFHASVHETGLRDYSPDQVAVWSPTIPNPERYLDQAKGRTFLVAVNDDDQQIGYADLEPDGHIDHLYCRPDVVGTGVGSALYDAIEGAARQANIGSLYVEASEAARRLFERKGFVVERRNDMVRDCVAIHNYRMTKTLDLAIAPIS